VLTEYDEPTGRWLPPARPVQWMETPPDLDTALGSDGNGITIDQQITLRNAGRTSPLFSVWRPVSAALKQQCALAVGAGMTASGARARPGGWSTPSGRRRRAAA